MVRSSDRATAAWTNVEDGAGRQEYSREGRGALLRWRATKARMSRPDELAMRRGKGRLQRWPWMTRWQLSSFARREKCDY